MIITKRNKNKNNKNKDNKQFLNKKRFITCHSYVQSEINMLMHVADTFGFKVNTFTHILEGYKVADKMKAHGVAASTFSDWWAYKMEVQDAMAYNAAIMQKVGLIVAINSDDAEMKEMAKLELPELETKKEELEKQHTTLTDSITKKEKEIFIARNAITSLQQTQKDCTDQVAQLEAKLLRAQSDEQALNDKYKTENGDLQKKISDLNAQIANLTSTHTGDTDKQKEEVQKLVAQLTALQKAKDDSDKTCRDEQTQLQREKDDINAKLETNKKDITILNEKINTLNGEVSSQKTINKTLQDDITAVIPSFQHVPKAIYDSLNDCTDIRQLRLFKDYSLFILSKRKSDI